MPNSRPRSPQLAQAMKMLRMRAGLALADLEPFTGVTRQSMSRWENATATFPDDKIEAYLKGLNATHLDLERELAQVSEPAQSFNDDFQSLSSQAFPLRNMANLEGLRVDDELMHPWVGAGEVVLFERGRHPKRGDAAVVERRGAPTMVRFYDKTEDSHYFFRSLNPEATEMYLHSQIIGIHLVHFRGG